MADKNEDKITKLKSDIKKTENMVVRFKAINGKDSIVDKLEEKLKGQEAELKAIETPKKSKEPKPKKSGVMTKAECDIILDRLRKDYDKKADTQKKNIKSGKAISDGSLKPNSSLKNEAETLENKSEAGQKITKTEQKAIAFNIENIIKNCVEMIPYKKDADSLLKDLVRRLQELRGEIRGGGLRPGSQN